MPLTCCFVAFTTYILDCLKSGSTVELRTALEKIDSTIVQESPLLINFEGERRK